MNTMKRTVGFLFGFAAGLVTVYSLMKVTGLLAKDQEGPEDPFENGYPRETFDGNDG